MKGYGDYGVQELEELHGELKKEYEMVRAKGLRLNMARGKPSEEQLDLSRPMLEILGADASMGLPGGLDLRNYGLLDGTEGAKALMAELLEVPSEQVIVGGSSSLNMMYDCIARAMTHGMMGSPRPWMLEPERKFLCPTPGYDRHFAITEFFGFTLIPIPMGPTGPDMEMVERLVGEDGTIKGIWCVPKYSNPQGYTYSDETVRRMAALRPAAPDFRIIWDNAYCVHDLEPGAGEGLLNILEECRRVGNENLPILFASTSKITFPGAGVAAMAASPENIALMKKQMGVQTIGADKVNMERHCLFLRDRAGIEAQMKRHATILAPKFRAVLGALGEQLGGLGIARWTEPRGGYFICFGAMEGTAREIVRLCKEAGVILTDAGATHPYGIDPEDSAIRIAPSAPTLPQLGEAMEVFCLCVKLASVERLLKK